MSQGEENMEPIPSNLPEELRAALEDVRQIRELVDRSRENHPIRFLLRPHIYLSLLGAPLIAIYGIVSQMVLDSEKVIVMGLQKNTLLWLLTLAILLVFSGLKGLITLLAVRREEKELSRICREIVGGDYFRIYGPIFVLTAAACIAMFQLGSSQQIVGLICMAVGAIWIAAPLAIPIPEVRGVGVFFLVTGFIAMFVLPDFPFYKLAAIWVVGLLALGITVSRSFKKIE